MWGFGCVLAELANRRALTGQPWITFPGEPSKLSSLIDGAKEFSQTIGEIVSRLLELDVKSRLSAQEVSDLLHARQAEEERRMQTASTPEASGGVMIASGSETESQVSAPAPLPLPAGWYAATDESTGKEYYYTATGEVTWEHPNGQVLVYAARNNDTHTVETLVKTGINPDSRENDETGEPVGKTSLNIASECGHLAVVRALLKAGANIEARTDKNKWNEVCIAPVRERCVDNIYIYICRRLRGLSRLIALVGFVSSRIQYIHLSQIHEPIYPPSYQYPKY
jgi:hypothetical protein